MHPFPSWLALSLLVLAIIQTTLVSAAGDVSVPIEYPIRLFDTKFRWREELKAFNTKDVMSQDYLISGLAQDMEDIWIFENWFYGLKQGVILESGALDGHYFSTSFFFERTLKYVIVIVASYLLYNVIRS